MKAVRHKAPILIIDDNEENLFILEALFKKLDCVVTTVTSGTKALEICKHTDFACILSDVQMPNMNGYDFANALRDKQYLKQGPIIFISAFFHETSSLHQGYECGAVDFILKPYDSLILLSKVKIFLELYYNQKHVESLLSQQQILSNKLESTLYHDLLTKLGNRKQFMAELEKAEHLAMRYDEKFALLVIDIDFFKNINDSYGQEMGDQLLVNLSQKLLALIGQTGGIFRTGGDEFSIIMNNIQDMSSPCALAQKIILGLMEPYNINGKEVSASVSIGIAYYLEEGDSILALQKKADIALYRAKELGRNNFQFHSSKASHRYQDKMQIQLQLPRAIRNKEFKMYYQPMIDIQTGEMVGAEALIRWQNAKLGNVRPDLFIPIAERAGLIKDISTWVIHNTLEQLKCWRAKFNMDKFKLSVNISPVELVIKNFADMILSTLAEHDIPMSNFTLELTETHFDYQTTELKKVLNYLSSKKCRIALDDFGTGASSLSRLVTLPIDVIKIDKGFIQEIGVSETTEDVIELTFMIAKKLDLRVVIEGIETKKQLDFVRKHAKLLKANTVVYQGYYYEKAINSDMFEQLLRKTFNG